MIRGVSFSIIPNEQEKLLNLVRSMNTENYAWSYIASQSEIITQDQGGNYLEDDSYNGNAVLDLFGENNYIIFLKLQAYVSQDPDDEIHTYIEFVDSSCQILFLLYDCEFVEIYMKNADSSRRLYENAVLQGFRNVEFITDNNDLREKMDLF